jgi:hypothetical protein
MKWIKKRKNFLKEAKLRDVILDKQAELVSDRWGEKYLDYEEIDATDKIKQGLWKLSEEDKDLVLGAFFGWGSHPIDMKALFSIFDNLPEHFTNILLLSVDLELINNEDQRIIMQNFNPKKPTVDQLTLLSKPVFKKLSINDTKSDNILKKDSYGRPIKDEEGNMIRIEKEKGEPVFDNSLVNIKSFIDSYNKSYKDFSDVSEISDDIFNDEDLQRVINMSQENHNQEYKFDFSIFGKDIYLKIIHNPKDILNMSISKFYSSCQHLYTGSYSDQVLSNVFDPNSIPAFLYFDSEIYWDDKKISDILPISRMMIRNIDNKDDELKIYFDRTYPDRVEKIMEKMVEKYSGNKKTIEYTEGESYIFSPDLDYDDELPKPYHDRFSRVKSYKYIGKNSKKIIFDRNFNWENTIISPTSTVKEIIIETDEISEEAFSFNLNIDWFKFRYMTINNLEPFKKIKTDSIAFDKCKFNDNVLSELLTINKDLKKIQIRSCDFSSNFDLSQFEKLEEIQMIFTLNELNELKSMLNNSKIKKLVVSGDLVSSKEGKEYVSELKKRGINVETVGPVI